MKALCVDNDKTGYAALELGKWYEVIRDYDEFSYVIKLSEYKSDWFFKSRFLTIEQIRDDKLNILLR